MTAAGSTGVTGSMPPPVGWDVRVGALAVEDPPEPAEMSAIASKPSTASASGRAWAQLAP
jgi:hypothetical protein